MVTDQETNKVYFSTWLTKLKCWQDIRMTLEQARVPYGLLEGTLLLSSVHPLLLVLIDCAFRTAKSSRRILSWTEAMSSNVTIQLS